MHYLALAADYDGTLAHHGQTDASTLAALARLRASGRALLLVTGREMADLKKTFSRLELFDLVVAENGALLYRPQSREETILGPAPPQAFLDMLCAAASTFLLAASSLPQESNIKARFST